MSDRSRCRLNLGELSELLSGVFLTIDIRLFRFTSWGEFNDN